jgi:hypothetical protein
MWYLRFYYVSIKIAHIFVLCPRVENLSFDNNYLFFIKTKATENIGNIWCHVFPQQLMHFLFTLFVYSGVQHALCCVFAFVLCTICCLFLWIKLPFIRTSMVMFSIPTNDKSLKSCMLWTFAWSMYWGQRWWFVMLIFAPSAFSNVYVLSIS